MSSCICMAAWAGAAIIIPIVVIVVLTSGSSSSEQPHVHTQQPTTCTNTSTDSGSGSGSDYYYYETSIGQNTTLCYNTTRTPTPTPTPTSTPILPPTPVPIPVSSGSLSPLPNFPLSCQHVAKLRPGWNPADEAENGHNGVYHTKKLIEWGSYFNQAFPNQTLIFKITTRKDQHWNISYIDYQFHNNITLKGCAIVADVTSPTGYWEYWGVYFPSSYPLDWSRGSSSAVGNEQIHWTYGPDVYPSFQPRIKTYIEIIPWNITGKEPITCPNGTYVCTGIGQIGWTYNATSGVNKTITGLTQECYAESLGDINGCQTYYKHKNRFPPSNRPDPVVDPDPSPVIRACGNDTSYQLCHNGTCILKNQTCSKAITCAETRDCPPSHVCRSADYDDPHSFFRTCQLINHINYCPTLAYQPWTQVECDRLVAGRPYVGWNACDQYINSTWHSGCRTDYCQRDCLASYVIISCQDMFNDGSIQACPFGASPGYSPFVPGECICSDSWSTL